ncbi:MAG: hypothetical protein ACKO32_00725, partial [Planctomycetia bacterium]
MRITRRSVFVAEKVAKGLIYAGGFGTIAAVLLILGFLGWVVAPLFATANLSAGRSSAPRPADTVLLYGVDEYQQFDWSLTRSGDVQVHRWSDGARVGTHSVGPAELRVAAMTTEDGAVALGYADGTVRLGSIQFRGGELQLQLDDPVAAGSAAIVALDRTLPGSKTAFCALDATGRLIYEEIQTRENMLTGEQVREVAKSELALEPDAARGLPRFLRLTGAGDVLVLAWTDGHALRYDLRNPDAARVVETLRLCPEGAQITTLEWLLGQSTLLVGNDRGGLSCWFGIKPAEAGTADGVRLVEAHRFAG